MAAGRGLVYKNKLEAKILDVPAVPRVEMAYPKADKYYKQDEPNEQDLIALYSPRAKYTAEEKLAAVVAYVMTGTIAGVVRLTGFNRSAISQWKNYSSWWPDAYRNVKKHKQEEVDGMLTSIVHAAGGGIMDRLLNGDEIIDKNGNKVRRMMSGKEMAWVLGITFDKRALLRGDPTSRSEKVDQGKLISELKDQFALMAKEHLDKTVVNK